VKHASTLLHLTGAIAVMTALAGCSGGASDGPEASSTSSAGPAPTVSTSAANGSANPSATVSSGGSSSASADGDVVAADRLPDLVQQVRAGVPEITDALIYDETTDPNDLLGRPNGYTGAASLTDSRASDPGGTGGIDLGAVLEVWPTAADAQARADYIATLQKGNTLLGSEYHHVRGNVLLRVSGQLPPSVDAAYAAAFGA
jgi:hypothetical protein